MATLLLDENLIYWHSYGNWHDPAVGKKAQPDRWQYLGNDGWAITQKKQHNKRRHIFQLVIQQLGKDMIPNYPNEYVEYKARRNEK